MKITSGNNQIKTIRSKFIEEFIVSSLVFKKYSYSTYLRIKKKLLTYLSYDIERDGTPFRHASRAPATVPEYILQNQTIESAELSKINKNKSSLKSDRTIYNIAYVFYNSLVMVSDSTVKNVDEEKSENKRLKKKCY